MVTTSGNWSTPGNWSSGTVPGATSGTTDLSLAVFNANNSNLVTVTVDSTIRALASMTFTSFGAGGYTVTGNTLNLTSGGTTQTTSINAGVTNINSAVVLEPSSSTSAGAYTFTSGSSNAANTLDFGAAGILGGTTSSTFTLTLNGSNTGANTISGVIGNGGVTGSGGLSIVKKGTGSWALPAANTYTGTTTIEDGTLIVGALANSSGALAMGDATSITSNLNPTLLTVGAVGVGRAVTVGFNGNSTTGGYTIGGSSANSSTFSGEVTLNQPLTVTQVSGGTLNLTGNIVSGSSGTQTLKFNNVGAVVASSGVIGGGTGTIAVSQTGAGSTTLTGTNTYTGGTTLSAGSLIVGNNSALGTVTVTLNGGTLQSFSPGSQTTYTLANAISVAGTATISDNLNSDLAINGNITGSGTLNLNGTADDSLHIAGDVSGFNAGAAANFTDNTSGMNVRLSGSATNWSGAAFTFGGSGVNRALFWDGTSGATVQIGSLSGSGGVLGGVASTVFGNAATYQIGALGTSTSYSGVVNDGGNAGATVSVAKVGPGGLTLSGASTYSGGTTLSAGTLTIGASSNPTSGTVISGPAGVGQLKLSGGTLTNNGAITLGNPIALSASTTTNVIADSNGAMTLTGAVTGTGTFQNSGTASNSLIMQGDISGFSGTFSYADNNNGNNLTFSGSTAASLNGSHAHFVLSGATSPNHALIIGSTAAPFQMGDLSSTGGAGLIAGGVNNAALQIGALSTNTTYTGLIADTAPGGTNTGLSLTLTGAGALTLAGANTYTGGTTIGAAELDVGVSSMTTGSGANLTIDSGATGVGLVTVGSNGTLYLGGFNLAVAGLSGAGTVTNFGIAASTLTIAGPSTQSFSGQITDSTVKKVQVVIAGGADQIFSGPNGYSGGTTINNSTLTFSADADLPFGGNSNSGSITINSGAILAAGFPIDQTFLDMAASSSTGVVALHGVSSSNYLDFSSSGANLPAASLGAIGTATFSGILIPNGSTYRLGGGGGTLTVSSMLTGTASVIVGVNGTSSSGVVVINGTNSFNGGVTLNAGTLSLASAGALGTYIPGSGTITFNGGTLQFTASNTIDYSSKFSNAPNQAYLIDTNGQSVVLASSLSSSGGSLTKLGPGVLTLGAANTYSGGTTASAGALQTTVDDALGSGGLAIGNAAVNLSGNEPNVSSLAISSVSGSLHIAATKTLTVTQSSGDTAVAGAVMLTGANSGAGGALVKAGSSTLEINGAPTFGQNSAMTVNGAGTLRLNVTSGKPSVGTGVTVAVNDSASLELAGTTSALTDVTMIVQRASIMNNSTAASGVHVLDGAVQQVGGINGSGSVVVGNTTGASLTADHIIQASLVIGNGSTFTLAPSDSNGKPLAQGGLALADSLTPSSSFVATSDSLLSMGLASSALPLSVAEGDARGASANAVPEPRSIVLLGLGGLGLSAIAIRKRRAE